MNEYERLLIHWNKEWKQLFHSVRLDWLYTMPGHVVDFFEKSHITGAVVQDKQMILLLQYGEVSILLRKFTVALYQASVYFVTAEDGEEVHLSHFLTLPYEEQHVVTNYLNGFTFYEACRTLHQSSVSFYQRTLQERLIGQSITDIFYQDGHFIAVLENGQRLMIP